MYSYEERMKAVRLYVEYNHSGAVAVVQDAVSEDLSPLIEAHVGGQHRWGMFVATAHELEGQHRAGLADGDLADLVDDHQGVEIRDILTHLVRIGRAPPGFDRSSLN